MTTEYAQMAVGAADVDTKRLGHDTRMQQALVYALLDLAAAVREHGAR